MAVSEFFKRVLVPLRQRPTSTDLNRAQERILESLRSGLSATFAKPALSGSFANRHSLLSGYGFHGTGFFVEVDAANTPWGVSIKPGFGLAIAGPTSASDIDSCSGADWDGAGGLSVPLLLSSAQGFTIPTIPASGDSRIDIIEVRAQYTATEAATVGIFNTATRVFDAATRNKSLVWDLLGLTGNVTSPSASTAAISYKQGVAATGDITAATEPATTSGYIKIGRINLDNSAGTLASVSQDLIVDYRPLLFPKGGFDVAANLSIPGVVGGLGTHAINNLELPGGISFFGGINPAAVLTAGRCYPLTCYLIGGDLSYSAGAGIAKGVVTASAYGQGAEPRIAEVWSDPVTAVVNSALRANLAASGASWTNYSATATIAIGQPYVSFGLWIRSAAGAALSNTEKIYFNYHQGN
jgi:hypothetical protein